MKSFLEFLIAMFSRMALWFRYRIRVEGLDRLNAETLSRPGGVLFLPNHPTYYIDPVIATLAVWPKYVIRPMVVEYMYYAPFIYTLMKFLQALPMPSFSTSSNSLKRKRSEKMIKEVVKGLKEGSNFMIAPGGGVKHTAFELIGGASGAHRVLQECPEANVVLVRVKGLWGSSFSRAIITKPQTLGEAIWNALKIVLKNLIFFTPRREVVVELLPAPPDFPRNAPRLEFNRYLEHWYNLPDGFSDVKTGYPGDSLVLVSYSFWKKDYLKPLEKKTTADDINIDAVMKPVKDKVFQKLAEISERNPSEIKPEMSLATDLGLDSLDTAEVAAFLGDEFEVTGVSVNELTSVGKVLALASKQLVIEQPQDAHAVNDKKWFKSIPHEHAHVAPGNTVHEAFLNSCKMMGNTPSCVDLRSGVVTYAQMKLRAIVLAEKIKNMPGEYIGIMLPASVGANIVILATLIAGKVPMMVNWTTGPRHLESIIKLSNVEVVLSSWAFLDRLENVNLDGVEDQLVMLEDVAREISFIDKLKGLVLSKRGTKAVLKHFGSDKIDVDQKAVLLFTSGTESVPKGVPLTHRNIMTNVRGTIDCIDLYKDDILYGFLPPFHAFGFTVTGVMAPLAGLRVAFSPNPTDGAQLALGLERWKPTILCGTPSFLKAMFKLADKENLKQVRLSVSGAEKAPPELFEMVRDMTGKDCVLEGYGITECSPVLTFNRPGEPHVGVGQPMPGIEMIIVNPETNALLETGQQGMILVRGPSVFSGYLNPGLSSPFVTVNGKQWYKTGDLGYLDDKQNLTIAGRLKRFIKIGGEMVSLAAIEDALLQSASKKGWPTNPEGPTLAICAKEDNGDRPKIALFTQFDASVDDVNKALKESGFSNIVKVSSVIKLTEIPVMGTGKINYRALEGQYLA